MPARRGVRQSRGEFFVAGRAGMQVTLAQSGGNRGSVSFDEQ